MKLASLIILTLLLMPLVIADTHTLEQGLVSNQIKQEHIKTTAEIKRYIETTKNNILTQVQEDVNNQIDTNFRVMDDRLLNFGRSMQMKFYIGTFFTLTLAFSIMMLLDRRLRRKHLADPHIIKHEKHSVKGSGIIEKDQLRRMNEDNAPQTKPEFVEENTSRLQKESFFSRRKRLREKKRLEKEVAKSVEKTTKEQEKLEAEKKRQEQIAARIKQLTR